MATKHKHVTYLNASPAPHTWRTLEAQSFKPYNFGRSAVFALPGRGTVSEDHSRRSAGGAASARSSRAGLHQPGGGEGRRCFALRVQAAPAGPAAGADDGRDVLPEPGRFRALRPGAGPPFPAAWPSGFLMTATCPRPILRLAALCRRQGAALFQGPGAPRLNDLAYTEKVIFRMTVHAALITRTAAQVLVDQLRIQGVTRVFCVPGESYLPVLDALYDSGIEVIVCRNEGGAAMMAEAHGKETGRPGICFVTRGPGATNASGGIHIAAAGFHAHDPVRGPGGAGKSRPRRVAGNGLPRLVRQHGQMGGGDRRARPHGRDGLPRLFHRAGGTARAGGAVPAA